MLFSIYDHANFKPIIYTRTIMTISIIEGAQIITGCILATAAVVFVSKRRDEMMWYAAGLFGAAMMYVVFVLFCHQWEVLRHITIELLGALIFLSVASLGYKIIPGLFAIGWIGHIGWDVFVPGHLINPYVPSWYVFLCIGFDLVIGIRVAVKAIMHK